MENEITKEYELAVLVDDGMAEKGLDEFLAGPDYGAEIISKDPARLTQLAYPIKKRTAATLLVYYLKLPPENVARIRKDLTFQPYVLRSLIIAKQAAEKKAAAPSGDEAPASAGKLGVEISSTEELAKTLEELEK